MLEQVVDATSKVVPGADLVSVTLRSPDGRFPTPVHTDPAAAELDEAQCQLVRPTKTAAMIHPTSVHPFWQTRLIERLPDRRSF